MAVEEVTLIFFQERRPESGLNFFLFLRSLDVLDVGYEQCPLRCVGGGVRVDACEERRVSDG